MHIQIYDRVCCRPSDAKKLADFLASKASESDNVEFYDLNDSAISEVIVPGYVVSHIANSKQLPILCVNGKIVAIGVMPNLLDTLEILRGDTVKAKMNIAFGDVQNANTDCC